jgi:hypothetical protein
MVKRMTVATCNVLAPARERCKLDRLASEFDPRDIRARHAGRGIILSVVLFTRLEKLVMIRELFGCRRTLIADLARPWGASVNLGGMKACNP